MILKIDYVELPGKDLARSKHFFAKALGWTFTDYGPQYFSFDNAGLDGGMDGTPEALPHALVVLKADDLEAAQAQIEAGGGEIVKPIFFRFRVGGGFTSMNLAAMKWQCGAISKIAHPWPKVGEMKC